MAARALSPLGRLAVLAAVAIVAIDLASMGSTGAWDPWETHYGEVARQILVRGDPLDLWWKPGNGGPDGDDETTFWSKPALPFWCMALSMKLLGVGTAADPTELVRPFWPELALRLPSMIAGWITAAFLGVVVARLHCARAGLLAAVVLCTMPQFAIVTRQALTDMFFVGPAVVAIGCWLLAWDLPDRELTRRRFRRVSLPWDRAYAAFAAVLLITAVLPLAVLHQHVLDPATHEGLARNAHAPNRATLWQIHDHFLGYWALTAVVVLRSLRWRCRRQALLAVASLATGWSLLGKGLIGPALVAVILLGDVAVRGRWHRIVRFGIPTGLALFVLAALPWHHAMVLYRGEKFLNELLVLNNLMRFATGEQEQAVGGFVYYLQTLGIAALPWTVLLPWALVRAGRAPSASEALDDDARRGAELTRFALLWSVLSFWLITFSVTKYHHYLLPCLPPLAAVLGLALAEALARPRARDRGAMVALGLGLALAALALRDAAREPAIFAHLTTYLYTGMWRKGAPEIGRFALACAPMVVVAVFLAIGRARIAVATALLSALLGTVYVVDDYLPASSESWSQRSAIRTYFQGRGPEDKLVSWWFYYRGETWFTKADVWVVKNADREGVQGLVDERRGKGGALWFVTTEGHANRLASHLPADLRGGVELVYENFHYKMLKVPVP